MKTYLANFCRLIVLAAAAASLSVGAQTVLYNNADSRLSKSLAPTNEVADEVILNTGAMTKALIDSMLFEYALTGTSSGNEQARIRFYANDGAGGQPGTLLMDTDFFNIVPTAGTVVQLDQLNVIVPQDFTWSIQFAGLASDGVAAVPFYGPPVVGGNYLDFWEKSGGAWTLKDVQATDASFGAIFTGVPVSDAPGTYTVFWPTLDLITYGTALSAQQLNAIATVAGSFSYTPAAGTILPAGTNTLSAVFTPTDSINYAKTTNTATLMVYKAPLTIRADNKMRSYGETNPVFTPYYRGFVAGETLASLIGTAVATCSATADSPVGAYPITVSGATSTNYDITYQTGTLTIMPAYTVAASALPASGGTVTGGGNIASFTNANLVLPANGGKLESFTAEFDTYWAAAKLTDGSTAGSGASWSSPAHPGPQSFVWSFAGLRTAQMDELVINNFGEGADGWYSRAFTVYTSQDGQDWTNRLSGELLAQEGEQRFNLGGAFGRYLKLVITSGYQPAYWELGEVAVMGELLWNEYNVALPANGGNLDRFNAKSGFSEYPSWGAEKLTDGKFGVTNSWCSLMNPGPQSFVWSFSDIHLIDDLVIYNFTEEGWRLYSKDFAVYTSLDGLNWTKGLSGSLIESLDPQKFSLGGVPGRYLNLVITNGSSSQYLELGEVEVIGRYVNVNVTLNATPNNGYRFVNWTENGTPVSSAASYSFNTSLNRTLVANFKDIYVVAVTPTAGGTATGGGTFDGGANVTLNATADSGYRFVNWTENGAPVSSAASYTFTASANRALTANFIRLFTVGVSEAPAAGGSTSGGGTYDSGASVTVDATVNNGYRFVNWTEDGTPVSIAARYTFTASSNRTLVANFMRVFTVGVSALPTAGGTATGGGTFDSGTSVTVNASANSGFRFVNWTDNGTPVSSEASYTFTAAANRTLAANFVARYDVAVSAAPGGSGSVNGGGTYDNGASVTASATAHSGYQFVNWTENGTSVSSAASYTFTVAANRTLVANFTALPSYSVIASAAPADGGTVSGGNGAKINLILPVNGGKLESFTAELNSSWGAAMLTDGNKSYGGAWASQPNPGPQSFVWSFASTNLALLDEMVIDNFGEGAEGLYSRAFTVYTSWDGQNWVQQYTGELLAQEGAQRFSLGGVSGKYVKLMISSGYRSDYWELGEVELLGRYSFGSGASVTVNATPNTGFRFVNWTENGTPVSSAASYTFTASVNRTLVANFMAIYNIVVNESPSGSGTVIGGGTFDSGAGVTVNATANSGYRFVNWTEGGTQVSSSISYTFTASANRTLVANFIPVYFVIVNSSPSAGGTTTGLGIYDSGATVTVSATARSGYRFVNWTENGAPVSGATSYTFTAAANRALTANFIRLLTVGVSALPAAGGTATGGGTFDSGTSVTVNAAANSGYRFVNWTENGTPVSGAASYTFTVAANRALVANFMAVYSVAVSASPSGSGSVTGGGTFDGGASVTVNATANNGYQFVNWTENGTPVSSAANYAFTVAANRTLVANFAALPSYSVIASAAPANGGTVSGGSGAQINLILPANGGKLESFTAEYHPTWGAAMLTDGIQSGGGASWCSPANPGPQSFVWSLASTNLALLDEIVVYNFGEGADGLYSRAFKVYTSWDGLNWVQQYAGELLAQEGAQRFSLGGVSGKYVKLTISSGYQSAWWELGEVEVLGRYSFDSGASVTVNATANNGFRFVNWTEGGTPVSGAASYSFTVSGNRTLVANFVAVYTVDISATPSVGGSITGGGTYDSGASVTVTAAPIEGYRFVNWTENSAPVSSSASYTFTAAANRSLVANFVPVYLVTVNPVPTAAGTVSGGGIYDSGASVTVNATVNSGYRFVNWTEGGTLLSSVANYTFTVSGNRTLTANYVVNTAPVATGQSVTTLPDMPVAITLAATDNENNPLTFSIVNNPAKGVLTGSAPNLTYSPNAGVSGSDSFTFKANDGLVDSDPALVNITIKPEGTNLIAAANGGTLVSFTSEFNSWWGAATLNDGKKTGVGADAGGCWASPANPGTNPVPPSFIWSFADKHRGQMDELVVYNYSEGLGYYSRTFELHTSLDGQNWTQQYAGELQAKDGPQRFNLGGVTGSYVKLVIKSGYSEDLEYFWELAEVEVRGQLLLDDLVLPANGGKLESFTAEYHSTWGAAMLTDGKSGMGASWSSPANPGPQSFVWSFEDKRAARLDEIVLHNFGEGSFYSRAFEVHTSLDGQNWTLQLSGELLAQEGAQRFTLGGVTSGYVKLVITSGYRSEYWELGEVEILGTLLLDNLVLAANGGLLESYTSQYSSTWSAAMLTDGGKGGDGYTWASPANPGPQSFVWSFASKRLALLDELVVYNYGEGASGYYSRAFEVYTSMDGQNWTLQFNGELLAQEGAQRFKLGDVTGRFVRLAVTSGYQASYWELGEVEFMGKLLPIHNLVLPAKGGTLVSFTSEFDSTWSAARLTDGVQSGAGASWASSAHPGPQSFVWSFSGQRLEQLDELVIYNYGEGAAGLYSRAYEVYTSMDGQIWTLRYSGELLPQEGAQRLNLGVTGRYLKLVITSGYNAEYWELGEVQVLGQFILNDNLALPANGGKLEPNPISQYTQYHDTWGVAKLTDGNLAGDGAWVSAANPQAQSFVWSFVDKRIIQIDDLVISNFGEGGEGFYSRAFEVYTSLDGLIWTKRLSGELAYQEGLQQFNLGGATGRYVKLVITSGYRSEYWELGEVQIFGTLQ